MTESNQRRRPGIIALTRQLIGGGIQLARLEIVHARQEVGEMLGELKGAAILLGLAAALALMALITLVVVIVLGAAAALSFLPAWLVALLVFVLLVALAAFFAWRGIRKIRVGPPEETIASVKEDIAWAKRLLRRG